MIRGHVIEMLKRLRHTALGTVLVLTITFSYAAMLRWLPSDLSRTSQDALWALPTALGPIWWGVSAAFAGAGALTMFLYMIMNQPFSGLLLSRIVLMGAMVCFMLTPLNSGWLPWGVMLASIGGCYASFLIATNWCERQNKWQELRSAVRALVSRSQGRHDDRQRSLLG